MNEFRVDKMMSSDAVGFNFASGASTPRVAADADVPMVAPGAMESPADGELALMKTAPDAIEIEAANAEEFPWLIPVVVALIFAGCSKAADDDDTRPGGTTAQSGSSGSLNIHSNDDPMPPRVVIDDSFADLINEVLLGSEDNHLWQSDNNNVNITGYMKVEDLALLQNITVNFSEKTVSTTKKDNSLIAGDVKDVLGQPVGSGHFSGEIKRVNNPHPFADCEAEYGIVMKNPVDGKNYMYVQSNDGKAIYVFEYTAFGKAKAATVDPEAQGSGFKPVRNSKGVTRGIPENCNIVIMRNQYPDEEGNVTIMQRSPSDGQFFYKSANFEMSNRR